MIIRLLTLSFCAICKTKMAEVLVQSVVLASFNLRLPKPFRVHTKAAFSFYAEHYCLHNRFQWPSKHYIQGEDMMSSPDRNGAHRKCDWGMWQAADGSFAPDNDSNRNTITIQLTVPLDFGHKGWLKMQTQYHIFVSYLIHQKSLQACSEITVQDYSEETALVSVSYMSLPVVWGCCLLFVLSDHPVCLCISILACWGPVLLLLIEIKSMKHCFW